MGYLADLDAECCRAVLAGRLGQGVGFRVQGAGFRVQGSGFRVQVAKEWRVQGAGFRAKSRIFRFSCFTLRLLGVGCRISGRAISGVGFRVERTQMKVRVPSGAIV